MKQSISTSKVIRRILKKMSRSAYRSTAFHNHDPFSRNDIWGGVQFARIVIGAVAGLTSVFSALVVHDIVWHYALPTLVILIFDYILLSIKKLCWDLPIASMRFVGAAYSNTVNELEHEERKQLEEHKE